MKNIFYLLLFVSFITNAQVSKWRSSPPSPNSGSPSNSSQSPRFNSPSFRPTQPPRENDGVSRWRSNPPRDNIQSSPSNNGYHPQRYPNRYYNDWYYNDWRINRWNYWGAPLYGWNYWQPYWYFDDWGYRQPARVYIYENGKVDTVKGVKPNISLGLQGSTNKEIGLWGTIGNKTYFIMEYNQTVTRDNSIYFPYGQIQDVDFPIVGNLENFKSFYLGVGRRFERTGLHLMVGKMYENVKYRGKDALGYITFPNYKDRYMTIKIGAKHDFKNISVKSDVDPVVGKLTLGLGINF